MEPEPLELHRFRSALSETMPSKTDQQDKKTKVRKAESDWTMPLENQSWQESPMLVFWIEAGRR